MSYNYENNFVQTLNAAFSVITFLVEKLNRSPEINNQCL